MHVHFRIVIAGASSGGRNDSRSGVVLVHNDAVLAIGNDPCDPDTF